MESLATGDFGGEIIDEGPDELFTVVIDWEKQEYWDVGVEGKHVRGLDGDLLFGLVDSAVREYVPPKSSRTLLERVTRAFFSKTDWILQLVITYPLFATVIFLGIFAFGFYKFVMWMDGQVEEIHPHLSRREFTRKRDDDDYDWKHDDNYDFETRGLKLPSQTPNGNNGSPIPSWEREGAVRGRKAD